MAVNRVVHGLELSERRLPVFPVVLQQCQREQCLLTPKGVVEAALVDPHGLSKVGDRRSVRSLSPRKPSWHNPTAASTSKSFTHGIGLTCVLLVTSLKPSRSIPIVQDTLQLLSRPAVRSVNQDRGTRGDVQLRRDVHVLRKAHLGKLEPGDGPPEACPGGPVSLKRKRPVPRWPRETGSRRARR